MSTLKNPTLITTHNAREPGPLVAFLELWRPLLPAWVLAHVLERLVLQRLQVCYT